MTLNFDDVLALLEERPMSTAELAALLRMDGDALQASLCSCERMGTLKRVGTRRDWALPDHVARVGAPPTVDTSAVRAAILGALATGPKTMQLLAALTGYSKHVLKFQCGSLRDHGQAQLHARARGSFWALASWTPPASGPKGGRPVHVDHAGRRERILDALAGGPLKIGAIATAVELPVLVTKDECTRLKQAGDLKTVYIGRPKPAAAWACVDWVPPAVPLRSPVQPKAEPLRHPHERPPSVRITKDQGTSWWVGKSREELSAAAAANLGRMRVSKESLQVKPRLLQ